MKALSIGDKVSKLKGLVNIMSSVTGPKRPFLFLALISFEIFNYSTTLFALKDLLDTLSFLGVSWATILAVAFCGIDFAGIARLLTPVTQRDEPPEVWYLFGSWLLAATMNAILTGWAITLALMPTHASQNTITGVSIFVAVMAWLIRVLIIGTFSHIPLQNFFVKSSIVAKKVRA